MKKRFIDGPDSSYVIYVGRQRARTIVFHYKNHASRPSVHGIVRTYSDPGFSGGGGGGGGGGFAGGPRQSLRPGGSDCGSGGSGGGSLSDIRFYSRREKVDASYAVDWH